MPTAQEIALRPIIWRRDAAFEVRRIEDENTLAAALCYVDLEKRGLVTIDNEDGMLVTITPAGLARLRAE